MEIEDSCLVKVVYLAFENYLSKTENTQWKQIW